MSIQETNNDYQLKLLIKMYDECQSQRRHHEKSRTTLSICLITAYTTIFGFAADGALSWLFACIMILFLSFIGMLSVMAYSERYNFYWRRSQCIRKYLDQTYTNGTIGNLLNEAKTYVPVDKDERKSPDSWPKCLNHHHIWMLIHRAVFIFCSASMIWIIAQKCA